MCFPVGDITQVVSVCGEVEGLHAERSEERLRSRCHSVTPVQPLDRQPSSQLIIKDNLIKTSQAVEVSEAVILQQILLYKLSLFNKMPITITYFAVNPIKE